MDERPEEERTDEHAERREREAYEQWREEQVEQGRTAKAHVRAKPKDRRDPPPTLDVELPAHFPEAHDEVIPEATAALKAAREHGKNRSRKSYR